MAREYGNTFIAFSEPSKKNHLRLAKYALRLLFVAVCIVGLAGLFWALLAKGASFEVVPAITGKDAPQVDFGAKKGIWAGYPLLRAICATESDYSPTGTPRQFLPDGKVLWGWQDGHIVNRDVGACQLNTWVWESKAKSMGLDIVHSEDDNITFAKWLFNKYGWKPWIASKRGWDSNGTVQ